MKLVPCLVVVAAAASVAVLAPGLALAEPRRRRRHLDLTADWPTIASELEECLISTAGCFDEDDSSALKRHVHSRALCESYGESHAWRHHGTAGSFGLDEQGWGWRALREEALAKEASLREDSARGLFLVRLAQGEAVSKEAKEAWEKQLGASLGDYLACGEREYMYLHGTVAQAEEAQSLLNFEDVFAVPDKLKLSHELSDMVGNDDFIDLRVLLSYGALASVDEAHELAREWRSDLGGKFPWAKAINITAGSKAMLMITGVPREAIEDVHDAIASQPETSWIEPRVDFEISNYDAAYVTLGGVSLAANAPLSRDVLPALWKAGITGKGQVVGVGDSGLDVDSCYFSDAGEPINQAQFQRGSVRDFPNHRKLAQYFAQSDGEDRPGGHGTHVAGTVAGYHVGADEESFFNGIAYEAKVAMYDIGRNDNPRAIFPPQSISQDMLPPAYNVGARFHTNSWGGPVNAYTTDAREIDIYSWENQDFVVLVAAGNSGAGATMGTPATAKNCISVGASMNSDRSMRGRCQGGASPCTENMAPFSSNGPTYDNRIKPDVVAPGMFIYSASAGNPGGGGSCQYKDSAGTSMATPAVAGNAALVRQYFTEGFYPSGEKSRGDAFNPMGALVKAVLINSGHYIKGTYGNKQLNEEPSIDIGFGLVTLTNTLVLETEPETTRRLFVDGNFEAMPSIATTGAKKDYQFEVVKGSKNGFKVTLVWHDFPGTLGSRVSLVNDLDLKVVDSNGKEYFPNGLNAPDNRNNVEQIYIKPQDATALFESGGTFSVSVSGTRIPQGPQPYAIVVSADLAEDVASAGSGGGMATGGKVFVILLSGFAVYFVGGAVYKKQYGDGELEIPHKGFWTETLPGAVKSGAGFVSSKASEAYGKSKGLGGSKESEISNGAQPNPARPPPVPRKPGKEPPLPKNWSAVKDPSSGDTYYWNEVTDETTWDRPSAAVQTF